MNPRALNRVSILALAAVAGSAHAQCDYFIWSVPDFDQRRHATAAQIGLPNDGNMYCAPTSMSNWLGYFANAGCSFFGGPQWRDWQSNASYDLATNYIGGVGSLMGTDPFNGTGGWGEFNGLVAYFDFWAPGWFSVAMAWSTPASVISASNFAINNLANGYVGTCYGRYIDDGGGFFTRNGGHCITVTGVANGCTNNPTLYFRDPADDAANTSQSPFITRTCNLFPITANFRGNAADAYEYRTEWQLVGPGTPCFLDGVIVITPAFYIANNAPPAVTAYHPFIPNQTIQHPLQSIPIPGSSPVIQDVGVPPLMNSYYAAVAPTSSLPSRIYRYDAAAGAMVQILTGTNFKRLAFGRFGELYVADGPVITRYIPDPLPPVAMGTMTPTLPIESMDYDDAADELVALTTAASRRILRFSRPLTAQTANANLPTSTMLMGMSSLAVSPIDSSLWVCADMTDAIYKLTGGGSAPLTQALSIPLPPGSHPTGLNVTHNGHIIFSSNGVLRELEQGPVTWVDTPNSRYAGHPGGPSVAFSRNRNSSVHGIHDGPGYVNLSTPEAFPGTPDCYANCDRSTAAPSLNVLDFACFLNKFAAGDSYANCDASSTPPVLNVLDFACFLNKFAAGCP